VKQGVRMHSCRQCNFDLCDGCFQGEEPTDSKGESSAEEEKEEPTGSEGESAEDE
jgi:hypothetical protein